MSSGGSMAVLCLAIPGIVTMGFTLLVHSAKLTCLMSSCQVFSSVLMVRQESVALEHRHTYTGRTVVVYVSHR